MLTSHDQHNTSSRLWRCFTSQSPARLDASLALCSLHGFLHCSGEEKFLLGRQLVVSGDLRTLWWRAQSVKNPWKKAPSRVLADTDGNVQDKPIFPRWTTGRQIRRNLLMMDPPSHTRVLSVVSASRRGYRPLCRCTALCRTIAHFSTSFLCNR